MNEVVANKGLSFDSMRNVFLHLTLVEDRWISYIIPGQFKVGAGEPGRGYFLRHGFVEAIHGQG